jgi:hypothetical protein
MHEALSAISDLFRAAHSIHVPVCGDAKVHLRVALFFTRLHDQPEQLTTDIVITLQLR